jgi:hypothetical protein
MKKKRTVTKPKQPKPKARTAMTDEQNEQNERTRQKNDAKHRGAGSGRSAVANRSKERREDRGEAEMPETAFAQGKSAEDYDPDNYKEGSEFSEGDATKGKPDYEARLYGVPEELPMRDHRAYLLDQAEKNQRANDELNARQVELNQGLHRTSAVIVDPDYQRDLSMESALADVDMHTPEAREKRRESRAAMRAANPGLYYGSVPEDASGNNRTVQGTPSPGDVQPAR